MKFDIISNKKTMTSSSSWCCVNASEDIGATSVAVEKADCRYQENSHRVGLALLRITAGSGDFDTRTQEEGHFAATV